MDKIIRISSLMCASLVLLFLGIHEIQKGLIDLGLFGVCIGSSAIIGIIIIIIIDIVEYKKLAKKAKAERENKDE